MSIHKLKNMAYAAAISLVAALIAFLVFLFGGVYSGVDTRSALGAVAFFSFVFVFAALTRGALVCIEPAALCRRILIQQTSIYMIALLTSLSWRTALAKVFFIAAAAALACLAGPRRPLFPV
ncbi:MAG: hypothetical protein GC191_18890 [Azospirillum sp.]|nr:hypothetical protein [Azospirillum sp.]